MRDRYGNPEIYVTENGACYDDPVAPDGTVHDDDRVAYLRDHLTAARRALADGVNLRGYFVWSLLDNFEWAEGYSRRFGIIHVDFKSLRRTPKTSFAFLADIARARLMRNGQGRLPRSCRDQCRSRAAALMALRMAPPSFLPSAPRTVCCVPI